MDKIDIQTLVNAVKLPRESAILNDVAFNVEIADSSESYLENMVKGLRATVPTAGLITFDYKVLTSGYGGVNKRELLMLTLYALTVLKKLYTSTTNLNVHTAVEAAISWSAQRVIRERKLPEEALAKDEDTASMQSVVDGISLPSLTLFVNNVQQTIPEIGLSDVQARLLRDDVRRSVGGLRAEAVLETLGHSTRTELLLSLSEREYLQIEMYSLLAMAQERSIRGNRYARASAAVDCAIKRVLGARAVNPGISSASVECIRRAVSGVLDIPIGSSLTSAELLARNSAILRQLDSADLTVFKQAMMAFFAANDRVEPSEDKFTVGETLLIEGYACAALLALPKGFSAAECDAVIQEAQQRVLSERAAMADTLAGAADRLRQAIGKIKGEVAAVSLEERMAMAIRFTEILRSFRGVDHIELQAVTSADANASAPEKLNGKDWALTEDRAFPASGYEKLQAVFRDAHDQAAFGKGDERHANGQPFHEQRMQQISEGYNSPVGMAFQVEKKMREGLGFNDHERTRRELLGALNYLAGIVIFLDAKEEKENGHG